MNYELVLASIALQFLIVLLFWLAVVRRHLQMARAYPLYAIRDKLIYLVASEKLHEEDFLFQEFYKAINIIIPNSKNLTLQVLVRSIEEARQKGHDPAVTEKVNQIQKALEGVDDDVRNVIIQFYSAVLMLFIRNSLIFRFFAKILSWWKGVPPPTPTQFRKEAWSFYVDYRHAYTTVTCPA